MRKETSYYYQLEDEREVELPFDPGPEEITEIHRDDIIILGKLVREEFPEDPFVAFDAGEFYQFDRAYVHYSPRPDTEDFKEIIRANRGRVFYVHCRGDGYICGGKALIKGADKIEDADGFYIAPEDAGAGYAKGAIDSYSAWATGDVWGVCVWTYDAETLDLLDRDECWGFYGYDYANSELRRH